MGFPHNVEYECTQKCKLSEHGNLINLALTKRGITIEKLAAFIAKTCKNFAEIKDSNGRSALHLASSVDKSKIVEWLLNSGAMINAKDIESGSTALHRAIFYGCIDCAVLLMKYDANLDLLDDDTRAPLQYICKVQKNSKNRSIGNELLVWGTNKNYNLGLGNDEGCNSPQFVECFRKKNISIENVSIGQFHSMFLDKKGILYSVGIGKDGKLGSGTENSTAIPTKVKVSIKNVDDKICEISISKYHSMLLTKKGAIYVCGSNEYKQLGLKPVPIINVTNFKEMPYFHQCGISVIGIIARDYHSIAYNNTELYVWGTNTGQFAMNNQIIDTILPKQIDIPDNGKIKLIESTNFGIAIVTTSENIILYHNYKIKIIKPPLREAVKCISLITKENHLPNAPLVDKISKPTELQILILTETNIVYIWYNDSQEYLRCFLGIIRLTEIEKIIYRKNQVLILSDGDVYLGTCQKTPMARTDSKENNTAKWLCSMKHDISEEHKIRIQLQRITTIDRAINIFCDDDFNSFVVLQENSRKYYTIPSLHPEEYSFKNLLNDVSEFDDVHDIIFHVDGETFCAHKIIIYSRSNGLKNVVEKAENKNVYLNFKNLTSKIFKLILKHIYSNYMLTLDDIDDAEDSFKDKLEMDRTTICNLIMEFGKKFLLNDLIHNMKCLIGNKLTNFGEQKSRLNRLSRTTFPELYDITIKCANNQEICAHKCVLITRLEYFNIMLTNEWSEKKRISLKTIPIEYMAPVIDFLYTADIESFRKQNYSESFLYNMIVICDQFFINNLRKVCEVLILEKISIRKCGEILEFACSYNCMVLKQGCLDFICQNLSRVLMQRCLECCDLTVLQFINGHYREMFKETFDFRIITPDTDAVSDECLLSFVDNFTVNLDIQLTENVLTDKNKLKPKFKESKAQLTKRNYEKEGIFILKESVKNDLNGVNIKTTSNSNTTNELSKQVSVVNKQILDESNAWMKVCDKKELKKKLGIVVSGLSSNNILKNENKPSQVLTNLNEIVNNNKQEDYSIRSTFNIGDITPLKGTKVSQKQRKRLSSITNNSHTEQQSVVSTTPIEIPKKSSPTNAWGNVSNSFEQQPSLSDILKSPGSKTKSLSFSSTTEQTPPNLNKSHKSISKGATSKTPETLSSTSFNQIIAEEKYQKDYYIKLRNKSLVLTQIEETAISELKQFYNVDNCEDEIITIQRIEIPVLQNFAVWQKN